MLRIIVRPLQRWIDGYRRTIGIGSIALVDVPREIFVEADAFRQQLVQGPRHGILSSLRLMIEAQAFSRPALFAGKNNFFIGNAALSAKLMADAIGKQERNFPFPIGS